MKIKTIFLSALLAMIIMCVPSVHGAEMQWYIVTNTGLSFEMKDVKMLAASDNELKFDIISHNGSVLAHNVDKVKFRLASSAPILGDADGNKAVNLADMMHISSLILETFSGECDIESADVNFDDVVNVADIVATSNIIANGNTTYNKDNTDAQNGGKGWFLASYSLDGDKQLYSAKGITFVRDAGTDQYAWQPTEKKLSDYTTLGETYDIKNVKSFTRYMDSDNQFTVDLPADSPVSQDDIKVRAYGEELTPSEDRHYSTVANVVSVTNAEGKMLYECYASLDNVSDVRELEINALETAYTMLIPIFPFVFESTPDRILNTIKSLLAELPETHALADAIDRSIVKNGYLEMDDIDAEYTAAIEKIIEKLGLRDNYLSDKKAASRAKTRQLKSPSVIDEYSIWGLKLVLNSSEYIECFPPPPYWRCYFTAYNSNRFAYTAWLRGYKVDDNQADYYSGNDPMEYIGHILKPQRVSTFMDTFTNWSSFKAFLSDSYNLFAKDDFWFDDMTWDKTKLDFDMGFMSEKDVVIVAGPADNQFMRYYNILRVVLAPVVEALTKGINKMASDDVGIDSDKYESDYLIPFISDLLTDVDYVVRFKNIYESEARNGYKAWQILELTWPKFVKYLDKFMKNQLVGLTEIAVKKTFGNVASETFKKGIDDINENWNKYLKVVEKVGDATLGYLGLQEKSGYYDISLGFEPSYPLKLERNSVKLNLGSKAYIPIESGNGNYVIANISNNEVATANIEAVGSSKNGTNYVVKINAVGIGGCAITVMDSRWEMSTINVEVTANSYTTCPDDNHPHMIDLGLPSGTLWACCNVGAEKPEDYGGYYAWGETEEKKEGAYDWSTYIHCDDTYETYHDIGDDIAGTQYDAATVNWGTPWQMPTSIQMEELKWNTTTQVTKLNNISGMMFKGQNGGTIFLPAASHGNAINNNYEWDKYGYYWTSTHYGHHDWWEPIQPLMLFIRLEYNYTDIDFSAGYSGYSVRPVCKN